jgi:Resolvase, N terminal domain
LIRGYVRSSPRGQTIAAQVKRLRAAGVQMVYRETADGAGSRVKLLHMLDDLDTGDVVMVTRLDRLALAAGDLTNILAAIAEKGAGFHSLRWAERHRGGLLRGSIDRKPPRKRSALVLQHVWVGAKKRDSKSNKETGMKEVKEVENA